MGHNINWISTDLPDRGPHERFPVSTRPQTARMYDYYLGGKDHFEVDRLAAEDVLKHVPNVRNFARTNRHFGNLAADHLARDHSIDQFLDIGTGIPTSPNTHQIVQHYDPQARILYVDHDPLVLQNAQALMQSTPGGRIDYIEADLRDPQRILDHPCLTGPRPALDLTRPVALFLVAIFHFVKDSDDPLGILRTLLDALPAGSFMVMTHVTPEHADWSAAVNYYEERGLPVQLRTREHLAEWIAELGLELQPPGVTSVARWWPGGAHAPFPLFSDAEASCNGLVAKKQ